MLPRATGLLPKVMGLLPRAMVCYLVRPAAKGDGLLSRVMGLAQRKTRFTVLSLEAEP